MFWTSEILMSIPKPDLFLRTTYILCHKVSSHLTKPKSVSYEQNTLVRLYNLSNKHPLFKILELISIWLPQFNSYVNNGCANSKNKSNAKENSLYISIKSWRHTQDPQTDVGEAKTDHATDASTLQVLESVSSCNTRKQLTEAI